MTYSTKNFAPLCAKSACFGCSGGKCAILSDNNFGMRTCPFFKTREQRQQQEQESKERIKAIKQQRKEICSNG